jgi:predicted transposase/invertase (TIGR01784 family)
MTGAEKLKQIGRDEGIREGILKGHQEGRQEGRREGHKEVARAMLTKGIDRAIVMQCTGLNERELDELTHWTSTISPAKKAGTLARCRLFMTSKA